MQVKAVNHALSLARSDGFAVAFVADLPVGIWWICRRIAGNAEFRTHVTHSKIYAPPSSPAEALDQIDAWRDAGATILTAAPDHLDRMRELIHAGHVVDGMVRDAKVAAICLSHGIDELWTADRDFSRFPALATRNPLVQ